MNPSFKEEAEPAKSAQTRKWYQGKMSRQEARQKAREDWAAAERLDKRGLQLSHYLLVVAFWALGLTTHFSANQSNDLSQLYIAMGLAIIAIKLWPYYLKSIRWLYHWLGEGIAGLAAFAGVIVGIATFAVAGGFAIGYAVGYALAIVLILGISLMMPGVGAVLAIAFFAFAIAIAFADDESVAFATVCASAFVGAFAFAATFALPVAVVFAVVFAVAILSLMLRVKKMQKRVEEVILPEETQSEPAREVHAARRRCVQCCEMLISQYSHVTLGLAGRRGVGKTNLIHVLLRKYRLAVEAQGVLRDEKELEEHKKLAEARIRALHLVVRSPADFEEMHFIAALMEQIAAKVNRLLTNLLPAFKPYVIERILEEKRRVLRWLHQGYILAALGLLGLVTWQYLKSGIEDPWLKSISFINFNPSLKNRDAQHSKLYFAKRDSLAKNLEPLIRAVGDSINRTNKLLNPPALLELSISTYWDSLQRSSAGPKLKTLDSLRLAVEHAQLQLDSIAVIEKQHFAMQEALSIAKRKLDIAETPWAVRASVYLGCIGFSIALLVIWFHTREGKERLTRKAYDNVHNEIALYHRTNALLERLQYHMIYSEGKETGIEAGPFWKWLKFSGRHSRQTIRELRPFTLISLVEEYRQYIREVVYYLNEALLESGILDERVEIVIAIDELDKVLNPQRLHELLKSMKAVFELENVYYILSISEDALETYRLRHVETKNEIDSAFTHIFSVPPMDATASLDFYTSKKRSWSPQLLPAAIVFGGGVPRDMHRLAQLMSIHSEWTTLKECLDEMRREDFKAAIDFVKLNSNLSDEWRHRFVESLEKLENDGPAVVEQQMKEVEEMNFEQFLRENPATEEVAKKTFHHVRSVVRGMIIKADIYHRVEQWPTPVAWQSWPEARTEEQHEWSQEVREWLDRLEPLREGIFDLASDPLGVWKKLRR